MKKNSSILPVAAAILVAFLVIGWRYYQARFISSDPPRANDPIVSAGGPGEGEIPPIDAPRFEMPLLADQYLKDPGKGMDIEVNGQHRFYPFQILVWHGIVNDTFGGVALAVTYDPLTGTAAAYRRTIGGTDATFTTSGQLWNNNTLMKDRASGSLWPVGTGRAILGPLAGRILAPYPTKVMAWSDWRDTYPRGSVLTRDTGVERDYTRDPYADYYGTSAVWYPVSHVDARLAVKTPVYGIVVDGIAKAYPVDALQLTRAVDETFGTKTVHVAYDDKTGSFTAESDGQAVPLMPAYWFFWAAAYPDTQLYDAP